NSLRMRPDRIVVGEVRRQREAETLFEAMHTGHSVYATLHANDVEETINRLTNPPINIPKNLLPAISMIIVMYRNRRTGIRRIFQVAEILRDASPNVLLQLDLRQDKILTANRSLRLMPELELQTGLTTQEINENLREKSLILNWLVKKNINEVNDIGKVVATYYTNKNALLNLIKK
ncbi:MAG: ATPase, T2SS/T4P/T4SS family, partial [Nanoarchaeota archaeon]